MKEAIQEIKQMLVGKLHPIETLLVLDVLATIVERIQQLEDEIREVKNGAKKSEGDFNIGRL